MEFPITPLLDQPACEAWLEQHFHPHGLRCPRCQASKDTAFRFRQTAKSRLTTYRCAQCGQTFNLYSATIFQQRHLTPAQVVLLLRGVLKGEPSTTLATELELNYKTVLELRRDLQSTAQVLQPETPLEDDETETDELFLNAGEKRGRTL
jgi:transposase-like protein